MTARRFLLLFCALAAARVLVVPITLSQSAVRTRHAVLPGDVVRFHHIAHLTGTPYRDFMVEYPPITLGAVELLERGSLGDAARNLMWSQVLVDLAIAGIMAWGWGRRSAIAYLVLGLPFLLYPFIYLRLDLLSVLPAVGGLALVRRRHQVSGGLALAAACFTKVWPVALAPSLLVRRAWRGAAAFATAGVAGAAAWIAWGTVQGPIQVLTFRHSTGWEVESLVGLAVHSIQGGRARVENGAWRVGTVPGWYRSASALLIAVAVVAAWWAVERARPHGVRLIDGVAPVATITASLVLMPIISPQYVCWLLPFAAIAAVHGERAIARVTFVVIALSTLDLYLIKDLVDGAVVAQVIVHARNAALLVLLVVAAARLGQAARAAHGVEPIVDDVEVAA